MNTFTFVPATKVRSRLRLALLGAAGSGKTYTALSIAKHLGGGRIAVIDTERGSASKYAGDFAFHVLELGSYAPQTYTAAIHAAAKGGYDTLIIDSLSHAWAGREGALEMVDNVTKAQRNPNSFAAWGEVTPHQNDMVDAILQAPMHVIVTMRLKMAYVLEQVDGRQVPRKIGLQPVQRDGLEYEFDVVGDLFENDNTLRVGKTRCSPLLNRSFPRAGKLFADVVTAWLEDGAAPAAATPAPPAPASGPALVHRDVKPENAPAAPIPESTPDERALINSFAPLFAAVKAHDELRALRRRVVAAGGGVSASLAYRAWYDEMVAQALAAIGPEPMPGPAKAPVAAAPNGKAAAS